MTDEKPMNHYNLIKAVKLEKTFPTQEARTEHELGSSSSRPSPLPHQKIIAANLFGKIVCSMSVLKYLMTLIKLYLEFGSPYLS